MAKKATKPATPEFVKVGIEWVDGNVATVYANNMLVQGDENEVFLGFYETRPPVFPDDPEEKARLIHELKSVPARCVARVAISRSRVGALIDALVANNERVLAVQKERASKPNGAQ